MIVLYHGLTACDMGCLFSKVFLEKGRRLHITVDNRIFKVPGLKLFWQALGALDQNRDKCIELLKQGELIAMYPGGAREFFFSDDNYTLVWEKSKGFARVAAETKCKVLPMFTKNSREIHGCFRIFKKEFCRKCFDIIKFPVGFVLWGLND